jgi:galactose mutarotase-like enzyme
VYGVTELGLIGEPEELSFREGVALSDVRLHNLIVGHFPPEQATVRVAEPGGWQIEVGQREVASGQPKSPSDAFHFVFYASAEHRFFCPEPWLGLPNALNTRRTVINLPAGESFEWEISVRVGAPEA